MEADAPQPLLNPETSELILAVPPDVYIKKWEDWLREEGRPAVLPSTAT
jgi:hypothetical protein